MYGGGGIVSTTREVSEFFHALFAGEVFDDPATLVVQQVDAPTPDHEDPLARAFEALS
jgi:hypothetical protein